MSVSKIVAAAASSAGGAGLDVDEVFSTYLYTGNDNVLDITNNVDLTEGGLVWIKNRGYAAPHLLWSSETTGNLNSTNTDALNNTSLQPTFNNDGFTFPSSSWVSLNSSSYDYVSWTWRKAPKFFDCLKFVGNGTNQTISHNLGSVPGMIIVKDLDTGGNWRVYHRSVGNQYGDYLAEALTPDDDVYWNDTTPTDAVFTVGPKGDTNTNNKNYVAYLFAHNDSGDGGFGPDSDQDIIKCGSYTGTGSTGNSITLGFEPQWIMVKNTSASTPWVMVDVMRGMPVDGTGPRLLANASDAEVSDASFFAPRATGFEVTKQNTYVNTSGQTYIYMAIRRGPLAAPDDATKVFGVNYAYTYDVNGSTGGSSAQLVGYIGEPADLNIQGYRSGSSFNAAVFDRLRNNKYLITNTASAETSISGNFWDNMAGFREVASGQDTTMIEWTWRRAPSYFDVVAYTGNTTSGLTINHNLGVVPEMMWVKRRTSDDAWKVYHSTLGNTKYLHLNETIAAATDSSIWNDTSPTASIFTLGDSNDVNGNGESYIAYLFATVAGVSKVGSYTGDGTTDGSKVINCGFSAGARFVFTKRTDATGSWYVHDTARGIVASGNDPVLQLNNTAAENTFDDYIDPHSSGFSVKSSSLTNASGASYIFYAIA